MARCKTDGHTRRHGRGLRLSVSLAKTGTAKSMTLLSALALLLGFAGLSAASAAQASVASPAAANPWRIEKTPNPATAFISYLHGVSCTSVKACTAVGAYTAKGGTGSILAERWNGKAWRIQATPTPKGTTGDNLYGVSCPSPSACTAVGDAFSTKAATDVPLAESWNGKSWRIETTPSARGGTNATLFAVSCTSASACTAVGDYMKSGLNESLVERWNGKAWAVQAAAKADRLTFLMGVSCASARACTAVGYQNTGSGDAKPLAEGWNGKSWTAQKAPLPKGAPGGAFDAVSCTSATACTATGTNFGATAPTLAERWNGKAWRVQSTPNPPNFKTSLATVELDAVSCTSSKACTATGSYQPDGVSAYYAEVWNGTRWAVQTTPVPSGSQGGSLLGVSCVPNRCAAVGAYFSSTGQLTLALAN
jgi:hypothetical protein